MDSVNESQPKQNSETQHVRRKLFEDDPTEKKLETEVKLIPAGQSYFQNIPFILLLIFAWFSYNGFSSLFHSLQSLYYLKDWASYSVAAGVYQFVPLVIQLLTIPLTILYFAMLWGLVKQAKWTKILVFIWYVLALLSLGYIIYPLLNSIGYNNSNEFYYQGGLQYFSALAVGEALVFLAIDTYVVYYFFKKIKFND